MEQKQIETILYALAVVASILKAKFIACFEVTTIRKYTFNIGYLEHSTSVLKPMLKVTMLNV